MDRDIAHLYSIAGKVTTRTYRNQVNQIIFWLKVYEFVMARIPGVKVPREVGEVLFQISIHCKL